MGAGVTPATLGQLGTWPLSVALLAASVASTLFAGTLLPRASSPLGPGDRPLRFGTGRLGLGPRPGRERPRRLAAGRARPEHPPVHAGRIDAGRDRRPRQIAPGRRHRHRHSSARPSRSWSPSPPAPRAATLLAWLRVAGRNPAWRHGGERRPPRQRAWSSGRLPRRSSTVGFVATGAVIGVRFRGATCGRCSPTLPGAFASVLIALVCRPPSPGLGSPAWPALRAALARLRSGRCRGDGGHGLRARISTPPLSVPTTSCG